jgi:hypothetical protein
MAERKGYTRCYLVHYKYVQAVADIAGNWHSFEGSFKINKTWTDEQANWSADKKYDHLEAEVKAHAHKTHGQGGSFCVTGVCNLDLVM